MFEIDRVNTWFISKYCLLFVCAGSQGVPPCDESEAAPIYDYRLRVYSLCQPQEQELTQRQLFQSQELPE